MKKIAFCIVLFLAGFLGFSQDFPTYNSVMGIPLYDANNDFGILFDIESLEYPVEFIESTLENDYASIDMNQKKIGFQTTYKLNKLSLIEEERMKSIWGNIDITRKYFYDDKNKLIKIQFFEGTQPKNEYSTFQYHDNRVVKEITSVTNGNTNKRSFVKLDENRYQLENDKFISTYFIVSTIGKKVRSIKSKNKETGNEYETKYGFYTDAFGFNEKITYQTESLEEVYTFEPNEINKLSKLVRTDIKTNKKTYKFYSYLNDAYGNWIIKYVNGEGNELLDNYDQVKIRQITYPNGTVTGFTDPTNPELKKWLQDYHFKNFRKKMSDNEGAKWKKNNDGSSFWFTINGEDTAKQSHNFYIGNDLIVVNKTTNEIFNCKDYKTKQANVFHEANKIDIDIHLGFWYKFIEPNGKENFALHNTDGTNYDYNVFEKFYYDTNGNFIGLKKDGSQIVLENAKSMAVGIINPIVNFDNSKHGDSYSSNPNITNKPYEEESDYTWKKNEAGAYWFYKNNTQISGIKSMWIGNSLLVLDHKNNALINLRGFKKGVANTTYKAYKVNVDINNGFWYKVEGNSYFAYDSNGNQITNLEVNKWSDDKKSFIIKPYNSSTTYSMDNYNTEALHKVFSLRVINEKSTNDAANSSADTYKSSINILTDLETIAIKNCNADSKCLAGLFDKKYYEMSKTKKGEELNQAMVNFLVSLNNIQPGKLFSVMIKAETLDIKTIRPKLPQEIQDELTNQGRSLINNYNQQINSAETKKNVEKLGGSIQTKN